MAGAALSDQSCPNDANDSAKGACGSLSEIAVLNEWSWNIVLNQWHTAIRHPHIDTLTALVGHDIWRGTDAAQRVLRRRRARRHRHLENPAPAHRRDHPRGPGKRLGPY